MIWEQASPEGMRAAQRFARRVKSVNASSACFRTRLGSAPMPSCTSTQGGNPSAPAAPKGALLTGQLSAPRRPKPSSTGSLISRPPRRVVQRAAWVYAADMLLGLILLACGADRPGVADPDAPRPADSDPRDTDSAGSDGDTSAGDSGADTLVFYVSPDGDDAAAGRRGSPWATLSGAQANLRALRAAGALDRPVEVELAAGAWSLAAPWTFTADDSGTADAPVTWRAPEGEEVVLSGGLEIEGWSVSDEVWTVTLPEGTPPPAHLWVDGARRVRAHEPDEGWFTTAETPGDYGSLIYAEGDVDPSWDLSAALVHVVHDAFGAWETSLLPVVEHDPGRRSLTLAGSSMWGQQAGNRWTLENVPEALDEPGEWFYDDVTRTLRYLPLEGESAAAASVVVPVLDQLLIVRGEPAADAYVEHIAFEGLSFRYADWRPDEDGYAGWQAVVTEGAAVEVVGGRGLRFEGVEVAHVGAHGIWLREGTRDTVVRQAEVWDLGAGAVRLGTIDEADDSGGNTVDNCFLHHGGRTLPAGEGVWIGQSSHNTVTHNEIADFYYTGIQVGWYWGYSSSTAEDNQITFNHVHTIGQDVLSDLGGIYTLGVAPGTVISDNVVHDVSAYHDWGAFGLYADEGTSFVDFTRNLVFNVESAGFHQHYGEANVVSNNIFAFGGAAQVRRSRGEDHVSFYFLNNIVFFDSGETLYTGSYSDWITGDYVFEYNDWYGVGACELDWAGASWAEWQAEGQDTASVVADPLFTDPFNLDFTLKEGSPAVAIGFEPLDPDSAGLYGEPGWTERPARFGWAPQTHAEPQGAGFGDDFETTALGDPPAGATVYGTDGRATIGVTEAEAHTGARALELHDQPGLAASYLPMMWYSPSLCGAVTGRFAVKVEEGAVFYHEWRDWADFTGSYTAGPSIWIQDGALSVGGTALASVPMGEWLEVEIHHVVGSSTWDLDVTEADGTLHSFTGLPSASLGRLSWIGFVAQGEVDAKIWLDDLAFE